MANTKCSDNFTMAVEFLLLGFQGFPELQPFLFLIFFVIYALTVSGNSLIVFMVSVNDSLHTPMYFLLGCLSFLEIIYATNTLPNMLGGVLTKGSNMSLDGCITQFCFFAWLASTECLLLTLMAYDRYAAICHPLHYTTLMDQTRCLHLVIMSWVIGGIAPWLNSILLSRLNFPAQNEIDHFFCDYRPLLKAACSDTSVVEIIGFVWSFAVTATPFLLIIVSYVFIASAILRIPSVTGRNKAFSTCSAHLSVVAVYFGTLIIIYVSPTTDQSGQPLDANKVLSLLYTVATPLFNPIIYTLRNKDMTDALRKELGNKFFGPKFERS